MSFKIYYWSAREYEIINETTVVILNAKLNTSLKDNISLIMEIEWQSQLKTPTSLVQRVYVKQSNLFPSTLRGRFCEILQ